MFPAIVPAIAPFAPFADDAPLVVGLPAPLFDVGEHIVPQNPNWLVRPEMQHRAVCDSLYAQILLPEPTFLDYVENNNAAIGHAPLAVPQPVIPGMSEDHIRELFADLHQGHGLPALQNMFINYRFVIIMSEWSIPMVYVGNDSSYFYNWLNQGHPHLTSSQEFFANNL